MASRPSPSAFRPPALPGTDAITSRRSSHPSWILIDKAGYIANRKNATTAKAYTSNKKEVWISFFTADPPGLSYFCVHCPELGEKDFFTEPCIVHSGDNHVLLCLSLGVRPRREYFMYTARGGSKSSFKRLPDFESYLYGLMFLSTDSIAFVPYGEGEHFVLAAIAYTLTTGEYELHLFRSQEDAWTSHLLVLKTSAELDACRISIVPHKVITLGGGELGWVDLWNGIMVCNVLDEKPSLRFIPLPNLLPANQSAYEKVPPRQFRDVTCSNGFIKCVELEFRRRRICREVTYVSRSETFYDSDFKMPDTANKEERTYEYLGWRVITWSRMLSSDHWCRGCLIHADDILLNNPAHAALLPELVDINDRRKLLTVFPTHCIDGNDVVYLMSKVKRNDLKAWVVVIDMTKKTLEELVPFSTERCWHSVPAFLPCVFSKYLNTDSDGTEIGGQITSTLGSSTLQQPEHNEKPPENGIQNEQPLPPAMAEAGSGEAKKKHGA